MIIRWRNPEYLVIGLCTCAISIFLLSDLTTWQKKQAIAQYRQDRYRAALLRPPRDGPGENGEGVMISSKEKMDNQMRNFKASFNVFASEKMAMDRSLPDTRREECRSLTYPADLPTISAILIFNNEALSAILRTVHSIVNRTPPQYLHEVILLDDCSDHEELHQTLDDIVKRTWPDGIVKIVRRETRGGLVKARVSGARAASGDTIIIMDAHMEVNVGWAEPILHHLKLHPDHLLEPTVDAIRDSDLKYSGGGDTVIQGFTWSMLFWWMKAPKRLLSEQKAPTDPIKTFAMVGCVFAMNRDYFFHIGAFDEGMSIWGGENVELPLRVWMCGGAAYSLPCSRIGHLFRKTHPFSFPDHDVSGYNAKRLAEVWLDDYKRLVYLNRPTLKNRNVGDLSERKALRERLNCHSFKWFLDNIYIEKFVPDENVLAYGTVENEYSGLCLDTFGKRPIDKSSLQLNKCRTGFWELHQQLSLSRKNALRNEILCYERWNTQVKARKCEDGAIETHRWLYKKESEEIIHVVSGLCLDLGDNKEKGLVRLQKCDGTPQQKWKWAKVFE